MRSVSDEQGRARRHTLGELWNDKAWGVLAGALTALGLCGFGWNAGWPALGLVYVCVALFVGLRSMPPST